MLIVYVYIYIYIFQEEVPGWLKVMYNNVYFKACTTHRREKKDQFCIDCSLSLCSNCLPIHNHPFNPPHKIVKVDIHAVYIFIYFVIN